MNCSEKISVLGVGDLILDAPEVDKYFSPDIRDILKNGDITVGQIEVPHTARGQWSNPEAASTTPALPEYLDILPEAGFDVATLAGNHIFDQGEYGVTDTCDRLRSLGIVTVGAGKNYDEAVKPAYTERRGVKFAFINYNTVGPPVSWATPLKAGCAFIKVSTHYESDKAEPGGMPTNIYTVADPACVERCVQAVHDARKNADVVICSFHMGRMFTHDILQYQTEITHKAIDAGADGVMCHHSHTLLGIEIYKGKPIYYGLGHFVAVTEVALPDSRAKVQHRFRPFNARGTVPYWLPDTGVQAELPYYLFNEVSRYTMIASMEFTESGTVSAAVIPCIIDKNTVPQPLRRDNGGEKFAEHLRYLCCCGGFDTNLDWSEDGTKLFIS